MKRMVCYIGCLLWWWTAAGGVLAQEGRRSAGLFESAREEFRAGRSARALALLDRLEEKEGRTTALLLLRADVYGREGDRRREREAIEAAVEVDSLRGYPYYYFVLAEGYFGEGDYARAEVFYRLYMAKDVRQLSAVAARRQLGNCVFAQEALRREVKEPVEVYWATEGAVYWPSLDVLGGTLLFTEQVGDRERMWAVREGKRCALNFQTCGNFGAPSLTADGRTMYFSMDSGREGFDIYVSHRLSDSVWSEPERLSGPVNTEAWEAQPSISADGRQLYFASNRAGGRGGSDIWFSRLLGRDERGRERWSSPEYLYFNTSGDEMSPFLYFDGRSLFFASDGYPGMGKKDVYKVDLVEGGEPLHVGITVNTQREEFGFMVDASGEWGYFSSDVSGRRCIYRYRLAGGVVCPAVGLLRVVAVDEGGRVLSPEGVTLSAEGGGEGAAEVCVRVGGRVCVRAVKRGYLPYADTLWLPAEGGGRVVSDTIVLRAVESGRSAVLRGVFFGVDDDRLREESKAELEQWVEFLELHPAVKIEIGGYTDDTGGEAHNARLSEDRAFEVYKYLFLRHIGKDRMVYRGYGAEGAVAGNATAEGRALNRRTEIKIR